VKSACEKSRLTPGSRAIRNNRADYETPSHSVKLTHYPVSTWTIILPARRGSICHSSWAWSRHRPIEPSHPQLVRQTPHSTPVPAALNFLLPFSAQKSHVKPQNHITLDKSTTCIWHFSSPQSSIIKLEIKKSPGQSRGFPVKEGESALTRLPGRI
jgi:hypothetical protein